MNHAQIEKVSRKAIAHVLVNRRADVIRLLRNAGAPVAEDVSSDDLVGLTLRAVRSSAPFRKDLTTLMAETLHSTEGTHGLFGIGDDDEDGTVKTTAAATTKTSNAFVQQGTFSGFLDKDKMNTIFNTGMGILSNKLAAGTTNAGLDKSLAIEQEKTKQAMLLAEAQKNNGGSGNTGGTTNSGLSTGVKVALGVGAAALLGVTIYFIVKATKK